MRAIAKVALVGLLHCVLHCPGAHAQEPPPGSLNEERVWVPKRHPGSVYASLSTGLGLFLYGTGTGIGALVFARGQSGDDGTPEILIRTVPWILPVTIVPGIILLSYGGIGAARGMGSRTAQGEWLELDYVKKKRLSGMAAMAAGAVLTGMSIAMATGGYIQFRELPGALTWIASVPLLTAGSIAMGIGTHMFAKFDYALSPLKYLRKSTALTMLRSMQVMPVLSQSSIGFQLACAL